MENILFDGVQWSFLAHIVGRTVIMFAMILLVLRLSGRRGVRQLTLFEVAIILGMGSAASDPMFQKETPLLYGIAVLLVIMLVYKTVTWLVSRSTRMHHLMEGREMLVVRDGLFEIKHEKDTDFTKMEFFSELRNMSVEHLGQVRMALLETDGSLSVLFYADESVRYGLPLFPIAYEAVDPLNVADPIACMHCGFVQMAFEQFLDVCPRCKEKRWAIAMNSTRTA